MSIVLIKGPAKSGKSTIANALRNNQIAKKEGALLIDETAQGELKIMLEKILIGVYFPAVVPDDWEKSLPWKPNSMVILVGEKVNVLADIGKLLPGFDKKFGPVYTVDTGVL